MIEIYPSLISADLLHLQESMDALSKTADGWHLDVMDNHFVPNLTWGAQFMNAIALQTDKKLWVHLMIDNPTAFLDTLFLPHQSYITFHIETKDDIPALIAAIKKKHWRASIAINPTTDIRECFPYVKEVDQVLIMSVEPGFSGQSLIPETLKKIVPLKHAIEEQESKAAIAIDGGINRDNITAIAKLGVQQFGIASGIFSYPDPAHELRQLKDMLRV